jgi:hypothetical protein
MWSAGLSWLCSCKVTRVVCLRGPTFCTLAGKQLEAAHSYSASNFILVRPITCLEGLEGE